MDTVHVYIVSCFQHVTSKNKMENLVTSLLSDMVPSVRKAASLEISVMELIPLLTDIIQPSLRPVSHVVLVSFRYESQFLSFMAGSV